LERVATDALKRVICVKFSPFAIAAFLAAWPNLVLADEMGVMERARPDYDAKGLPLGGFRLYPTLDLDAAGDTNVYRTQTATSGDAYFTIAPNLDLKSDWTNNLVEITAAVSHYRYVRADKESRTDWNLGGHGRLDILRGTTLDGEVDYVSTHEPRYSPDQPGNAAEPTHYSDLHAESRFTRNDGRLGFTFAGAFDRLDYDATPLVGGGVLNNDNRDERKYALKTRVSLELSEGYVFFVRGTYNSRGFDLRFTGDPNRNSHGYALDGGAEFRLTDLLRGETYLGYAEQDFHDPLPNVGGIDFGAKLIWYPDALYTVHLSAQRRFTDTTIFGASVSDDRVVELGVDYELMRDLILQGGVSYTSSRFAGAVRNDTVWGASLQAQYLIDRNMRAVLGYDFSNRASSVPFGDYRDSTVHLGLKFAL
jgi:hypothetical protein